MGQLPSIRISCLRGVPATTSPVAARPASLLPPSAVACAPIDPAQEGG